LNNNVNFDQITKSFYIKQTT